jgi:3',5'-cyclic AMP phosphodiesterase CpdA
MPELIVAQLTDVHAGATWGPTDPIAGLEAALRAIASLSSPVDAVVISGDVTDNGLDHEYAQVVEQLAGLDVPIYALPGNHDDRDRIRRHFRLPGAADGAPVQYSVDLGALRLLIVDSTRPGHDQGQLDAQRLDWLDGELAAAPDVPTLVAMHHPPFSTGMPAFDRIGMPDADRRALGTVLERHRQVRKVVAGHIHTTSFGAIAGLPAMTVPGTYAKALLRLDADHLEFVAEPPTFAVHVLSDGELTTHVESAEPEPIEAVEPIESSHVGDRRA